MDASVPICPNPVFIIGSPRSGTSALAWALAQHPALWTSRESELLYNLFGSNHLDKAFDASETRPDSSLLKEEGIGKSEFLAYLGMGLNAMFSSASHPKRWVDQTPVNTLLVDTLAEMFPGALFLHILRDGRRVVNSMSNFVQAVNPEIRGEFIKAGYLPAWALDFSDACRTWSTFTGISLDFCAKHPRRGFTIKNEDLIRDPEDGFRKIFEFLGVDPHPGSAAFFSSNRVNSSFGSGGPAPRAGDLKNPWLGWNADEKRTFFEEAGATMVSTGFATEEEIAATDEAGVRLALKMPAPGSSTKSVDHVRQIPLEGPVRQASSPEGLWHDLWVGPQFRFRLKTLAPLSYFRLAGNLAREFPAGLRLDLTIAGQSETTVLRQGGEFEWTAPCDIRAGSTVTLTVKSSDSFRPKDVGPSPDARDLSFVLRRIAFEAAQAGTC